MFILCWLTINSLLSLQKSVVENSLPPQNYGLVFSFAVERSHIRKDADLPVMCYAGRKLRCSQSTY